MAREVLRGVQKASAGVQLSAALQESECKFMLAIQTKLRIRRDKANLF